MELKTAEQELRDARMKLEAYAAQTSSVGQYGAKIGSIQEASRPMLTPVNPPLIDRVNALEQRLLDLDKHCCQAMECLAQRIANLENKVG